MKIIILIAVLMFTGDFRLKDYEEEALAGCATNSIVGSTTETFLLSSPIDQKNDETFVNDWNGGGADQNQESTENRFNMPIVDPATIGVGGFNVSSMRVPDTNPVDPFQPVTTPEPSIIRIICFAALISLIYLGYKEIKRKYN